MYTTLGSLILALFLQWKGIAPESDKQFALSVAFGILFSGAPLLLFLFGFSPALRGEQKSSPTLISLIGHDLYLKLATIALLLLGLLPWIVLGSESPFLQIILTGIGLDLIRLSCNRFFSHLNPFKIVSFLKQQALSSIEKDQDQKLCEQLDALTEIGLKAIQQHNSALLNRTVDALESIGERFLAAEKSFSHPTQNAALQAEGVKDTLSFVLIYLLQNLETLFRHAAEKKMDFALGNLITTLTKLASYSTKIDLTLTTLPLHYVGKLAEEAQAKGQADVGVRATLGLLEVAKKISQLKDLAYLDIKPSLITLIIILDRLAKGAFKLDKTSSIQILTQPFVQLRALIAQSPLKDHQDRKAVEQKIDQIMAEFEALDTLLKTMPPLPTLSREGEPETQAPAG